MRTTLITLGLLTLAAACGGDSDTTERAADARAAAEAQGPEDPGLPTEQTEFRPTSWGGEPAVEGLAWISTATDREDEGISLVAELRGLGAAASYAWALHRGTCSDPDERALGLGYGAVADAEGSAPDDVPERGDRLGDAALTFTPAADGTAANTVFVPVGGDVTLEALGARRYTLRVHPNVVGDDPGPSVACAPLPAPADGGSEAGERR